MMPDMKKPTIVPAWDPAMMKVDMVALSCSGAHLASMLVMHGKVAASQSPIKTLISTR